MELAWCYYQNSRFEDGIALMDGFVPDEEHYLDYHNLKGRIFLTVNKDAEALEHLVPWLHAIQKLRPDGTKKTTRQMARLGYAYYTIASAKADLFLWTGRQSFRSNGLHRKSGGSGAGFFTKSKLLPYSGGYLAAEKRNMQKCLISAIKLLRLTHSIILHICFVRKPVCILEGTRKLINVIRERQLCIHTMQDHTVR